MTRKEFRNRLIFPVCSLPVAALALGLFTLTMHGCNTTAGLGEDIEAGGDALEDAAEDAND